MKEIKNKLHRSCYNKNSKAKLNNIFDKYLKIHNFFESSNKLLILKDIIFIVSFLSAIVTIGGAYISSREGDSAALEYYRIGEKYYRDKYYVDALNQFEKAYKINKGLLDVKYYYVMSLIYSNEDNKILLARKILYQNSEYLTDNEKAAYSFLECKFKNYGKATEVLDKLDDPVLLKNEVFPLYIKAKTISSFNNSFKIGEQTIFQNRILIDCKKNSLGTMNEDTPIEKFSDVQIELPANYLFNEWKYIFKGIDLWMLTYYYKEIYNNREAEKLLPILRLASESFTLLLSNKNYIKEYLGCLYNYIENASGFNEIHLSELDNTLKNVIKELESGSTDIYRKDLNKCKGIYNNLISQYNTEWKPYIISNN
ncbi:hypothetical protein [Cellulosilyticum sp. I15G10I2]|uniref:hypothetical protein n=1 Tax=Cellulosilyticum sp. I15G10I2 TaxID=1892843 RepID=UPI00085C8D36|nr:hypothetical protein [Cellulosilyticum sp. I15G10I2]